MAFHSGPRQLPLLVLLANAPALATGWAVGYKTQADILDASANLDPFVARWTAGSNTSYSEGLKGGISWALDPALCDALIPRFPEEEKPRTGLFAFLHPQMISCARVRESIRTAMKAWEAANSNVRFYEVSALCDRGGWQTPPEKVPPSLRSPPPPTTPPPPCPPPTPPLAPPSPPTLPPLPPLAPGTIVPPANATGGSVTSLLSPLTTGASTPCDNASLSCIHCVHAELLISGFKLSALQSYDAAYLAEQRMGHLNAVRSPMVLTPLEQARPLAFEADYQPGGWLRGDYRTGEWVGGFAPVGVTSGQAIHSATIEFDVSPERCFWHDSDVCVMLLRMQSGMDADLHALLLALLLIATIAGYTFAVLMGTLTLYRVFQVAALSWDTDGDGVVEFHEVVQAVKVVFAGALLRARDRWQERKGRETISEKEAKTIEWRAALYGFLDTIRGVNNIQYILLCLLLFWPRRIIESVLAPCHDCSDFHLTLMTQLGMVLGLQTYTKPPDPPECDGCDAVNASDSAATTLNNSSSSNTTIFATNRSAGYNCSHPLQAVGRVDSTTPGAPAVQDSLMGQPRPAAFSLKGGWPRLVCPTADDADGLRYLYPECDELLGCETAGGANVEPGVNQTAEGVACSRFTPHPEKPYSIIDYYAPLPASNWSNPNASDGGVTPWEPSPLGRVLPDPVCVRTAQVQPIVTVGAFRMCFSFAQSLFGPLVFLLIAKIASYFCLYMPWMKKVRKRNEKLQRTLAKRRAEVRRMTEGGQEFVVKRVSKATGRVDVAQTALTELTMKAAKKEEGSQKAKKKEAGAKFLTKMKKEDETSFKGSAADGAGVGAQLAITDQSSGVPAGESEAQTEAPSMAIVTAGASGPGAEGGSSGFAQEMRQLSAAAEAEDEKEEKAKEEEAK